MQKEPVKQPSSPPQALAQEDPWQTPGAQLRAAEGARQAPKPSQVRAATSIAASHVPAAHSAPDGCRRHAPLPSQVPSRPQGLPASGAQAPCGSCPAATGVQAPSRPGAAQVEQMPSQAVAQQIPRVQCPDWHCEPRVQGRPLTTGGGTGASGTSASRSVCGSRLPISLPPGAVSPCPSTPLSVVGDADGETTAGPGRDRSTQPATATANKAAQVSRSVRDTPKGIGVCVRELRSRPTWPPGPSSQALVASP